MTRRHCRYCRYSEGQAVERKGSYSLVLWCLLWGRTARRVCEKFAPLEGEA